MSMSPKCERLVDVSGSATTPNDESDRIVRKSLRVSLFCEANGPGDVIGATPYAAKAAAGLV